MSSSLVQIWTLTTRRRIPRCSILHSTPWKCVLNCLLLRPSSPKRTTRFNVAFRRSWSLSLVQNVEYFPEEGSTMSLLNVKWCAFFYLDNTTPRLDIGGVDLWLHHFLTLGLDVDDWSASRSGGFTPAEWAVCIHWIPGPVCTFRRTDKDIDCAGTRATIRRSPRRKTCHRTESRWLLIWN
jgi:hypothetical protein